jgi:nucleotide-binding universal stress UspA family protein
MHSDVSVSAEQPVVVGVDRGRNRSATVDLAATEAARRRAPLLIVHVWPGRYTGGYGGRGELYSVAEAERVLRDSARRAQAAAPGLRIRTEVLDGNAATILNLQSERASLLVVGHRDDATRWSGWGGTTAFLAHHSLCPLLVHRGVQPARGPVAVAASARRSGAPTLDQALEQARALDTRLVAVHMWMRPGGPDSPSPLVVIGGYTAERQAAAHALAEALAAGTQRFPDVPVDQLLVNDRDFAPTIERASRRARLLVAGIGEGGSFTELLCGPIGPNAVRRTSCPVLLVPVPRRSPGPVLSGRRNRSLTRQKT